VSWQLRVATSTPAGNPASGFFCTGDDYCNRAPVGVLLGADGDFHGQAYCADEQHMANAIADQQQIDEEMA
jgi:hypothetical protein